MSLLNSVIKESEDFLKKEEKAQKCNILNVLEFINFISDNSLREKVKVREFEYKGISLSQVYVELNGEYFYSTTIR